MSKKEMIGHILDAFKAMGASWLQLKIEHARLTLDINYLHDCEWLISDKDYYE